MIGDTPDQRYFRLMAAIINLLITLTSESIRISRAGPRHFGCSRWNLVAIMYTSICTS